jgi:hypothetical protein
MQATARIYHDRDHPCPVCGGWFRAKPQEGRLCNGYRSDLYLHCQADELAGPIFVDPVDATYAHAVDGPCECGGNHGAGVPRRRPVLPTAGPAHFKYVPGNGHLAVDAACRSLAGDPTVFQRAGALVAIARAGDALPEEVVDPSSPREREPGDDDDDTPAPARRIARAPDAPVISPISSGRLWEHLSRLMAWARYNERKGKWVPSDPPDKVVSAVHSRKDWPGVRVLNGVVTAPVLRPDGSILTRPGYDSSTGLFYMPAGQCAAIPDRPTIDDARASASSLFEVVCDFPFAEESHKAAWLAALLSPIAFPAYEGNAPMFVFDATTPGTGKSLAADIIGLIATGQPMAGSPYVAEDEEMRKRIMAHAQAGDFCILVDNAPNGGRVGWTSLDMALTRGSLNDRMLGKSENARLVLAQCWYVTGNNLVIRGDAMRRAIKCRFESPAVRPHERPPSSFRHHPLPAWVAIERPRLLAATLTLLRAYLLAGAPQADDEVLGSFEGWSRMVRGAVMWCGAGDPLEQSAGRDPEADPEEGAHVAALEALQSLDPTAEGMTAAEIVSRLVDGSGCSPSTRQAFVELCPPRSRGDKGGLPNAQELGWKLRSLRGRWRALNDGRVACFDRPRRAENSRRNVALWAVRTQ